MKINRKKIQLYVFIFSVIGCATQNRRFGNIPNLSIDQIVHKNILQAVGVKVTPNKCPTH